MAFMNSEVINASDGKKMNLIQNGRFLMGSQGGYVEEAPQHWVNIHPFYIDQNLVTNREFKRFCDETGNSYPSNPRWKEMPEYFIGYPEYPVINVSWQQAKSYAAWAGKRLPTEEEWEYAASGGLESPKYPWGNKPPHVTNANYADRNTDFPWRDFKCTTGYKYTAPVGSYQSNGYGLYDMAGNVWQWCEDWYFEYSDTVKDTNAFMDGWGGSKICRGGCYHSDAFDLRISRRRQILAGGPQISVGFRCVMDLEDMDHVKIEQEVIDETDAWLKKLAQFRVSLQDDMELCMGTGMLTLERAEYIKNAGFTSVEQYVTWETIENTGENCWDFSVWDEQVAILKEVGLKWVPFLIGGPAYSLPDWYRESRDFEGLCCLEHNIESKIQSIWDKNFYKFIDRFISKVAERYRDSDIIEALLLGITGDFGEAIFPVWHGNWPTQISGLYHSHGGYWCNDRFAQQDFIGKMKSKFGHIEKLNAAWGVNFSVFGEVKLPELKVDPIEGFRIDEYTNPGIFDINNLQERSFWLDFVDWYRSSMTDYADFWMETTRKYFPIHPIYLCTGGDATSSHGSHFAQQCKIAANHQSGIRITNEASNYAINFTITNWVASASNFYNAYFGFEPAGKVTEKGVVCRIYNATATGAKGLHFYDANLFDHPLKMDVFMNNIKHLYRGKVKKIIGVLYPDTSLMIGNISSLDFSKGFEMLRNYTDYIFLDDVTIRDGILNTIQIAFICCGEIYKEETLDNLLNWVSEGGILIGYNVENICSAEENKPYQSVLFNNDHTIKEIGKGRSFYIHMKIYLKEDLKKIYPGPQPTNIPLLESDEHYQSNLFDPITEFLKGQGHYITNGYLNGVYESKVDNQILLLNTRDEAFQTEITHPDGYKKLIKLDYNSIVSIEY